MATWHSGRLLVAAPALDDPNFDRAVVLVLDHDEDGALGVVLNRPSSVLVADTLEDWTALAASPPVVFGGGPGERTAGGAPGPGAAGGGRAAPAGAAPPPRLPAGDHRHLAGQRPQPSVDAQDARPRPRLRPLPLAQARPLGAAADPAGRAVRAGDPLSTGR